MPQDTGYDVVMFYATDPRVTEGHLPDWPHDLPAQTRWEIMFAACCLLVAQTGRLKYGHLPPRYWRWIRCQRHRHHAGTLPEDQLASLSSIPGWDDPWESPECFWRQKISDGAGALVDKGRDIVADGYRRRILRR